MDELTELHECPSNMPVRTGAPQSPRMNSSVSSDVIRKEDAGNACTQTSVAAPGRQTGKGTPGRVVHLGSAVEDHPDSDAVKNVDYVVVLHFDDRYLRTLPGILRFFQVVLSIVALVCLTSSGSDRGGYLFLPLDWHLRAFVFTCVTGMLISLFNLLIQLTGIITMLPINWALFDTIVYGFLGFMFLFTSSLVASAIDFYQKLDGHVSDWTIDQLIAAVVFGYICFVLFGSTAIMGYRQWKGSGQFRRYRFHNSQKSTISSASKEVA